MLEANKQIKKDRELGKHQKVPVPITYFTCAMSDLSINFLPNQQKLCRTKKKLLLKMQRQQNSEDFISNP